MRRADRALDALARGLRSVEARSLWMRRWYVPVTVAGLTLLAIVAVFRMETSTPNYDPQYMRVLVERTMRFGGSYYSNGIHNKGPLEPLLYEIAGRLGGRDGWWCVVAVMTLVASLVVGGAAAVVTVRSGGTVLLGACVATMAAVHLTLSDADYAGVLYARNITTTLLAAAVAVVAHDGRWATGRSRRRSVLVVGVATGLAVQTLLTACFTAAPVLLWAMWSRRTDHVWARPAWVVLPVVSAAAFASAPFGYFVLGGWDDFVDGYVTHARFMSTGTGRSLASQFDLGWDRFVEYYGDRPVLAVVLVVFALVTIVRWRRLDPFGRGLRLVIAVWWLGAWVEMVLSQRYSSHYYSIIAVPTIMVIAVLVGDVGPWFSRLRAGRPSWAAIPLVVALVTTQAGGQSGFDVGVEAASTVRSTADFTARREVGLDGRTRMLRASLDLVGEEGDPLLVWTSYPWPYLQLRRTSATRYIWKTFLLGEIYLGRSGPEYVLPGTWGHFAADLEEADPAAYLVEAVNPIDPGTPFRDAVDDRFTDVYVDEAVHLGFRNDLARWLTTPEEEAEVLPVLGEGPSTVSNDGCIRIDGTIGVDDPVPLSIELIGDGDVAASISATPGDGQVLVESAHYGVAGHVAIVPVDHDGRTAVSLIVGERSAVLVVDGHIGGAVSIDPGTPVTIVEGAAALTAGGAAVSTPPAFTGC